MSFYSKNRRILRKIGVFMDYREKRIHGDRSLPIAVYETRPDSYRYHMNLHWHPEHEIIYVQSGTFSLRLNDQPFVLREGDVAFASGGTLHFGVPKDCFYTCVLVNLPLLFSSSDACYEISESIQSGKILPSMYLGDKNSVFAALCEQMIAVRRERTDGYPFLIKGLLLSFFGEILKQQKYIVMSDKITAKETTFGRLRLAISYIEANYASNIRLEELAQEANLSPNHFCKCFKALSGMTPFAYIIQHRLTKAAHALRTTDMTVTETALSCGFNDVSHFIRLFRRQFGKTPNQYRHRNTGAKE